MFRSYNFVTNEKLTITYPNELFIDDIAVIMQNKATNYRRSSVDEPRNQLRRCDSDFEVERLIRKSKSQLLADNTSAGPSGSSGGVKKLLDNISLISCLQQDFNPRRRSSTPGGIMSTGSSASNGNLVQRCIIVNRDENGYGLTVSGSNPVFVQSVKEDGAAARAGVREGDRIIKVNGTLVRETNHLDVVKLISTSSPYVALTLYGQAPTSHSDANIPLSSNVFQTVRHSVGTRLHQQSTESAPAASPDFRQKRAMTTDGERNRDASEVESTDMSRHKSQEEKQAEWKRKQKKILCQMLEDERKILEELLVESKRSPTAKNRHALEQSQKRIQNLEKQLSDTKATSMNQESTVSGTTANGSSKDTVGATVRVPLSAAQMNALSTEESDVETEQSVRVDVDGGPFTNFAELKTHLAHLAVFLHYLLSNSDPASLLFFLITDLYQSASGKELRKWAYEIHSTFLIPNSPLHISTLDHNVYQEIDNVLSDQSQSENEELFKKIFSKARQKAWEEINELLADFRSKRTLGLGNVFGENMLQGVTPGDAAKERKIADSLLTKHIETYFSGTIDYEQLQDRSQALASALSTVLKAFAIKPNNSMHEKLIDKCPLYVAKEKKGLTFMAKLGKQSFQMKGHQFVLSPIFVSSTCYQCQSLIWGLAPQAYTCSGCELVCHKKCLSALDEVCYGKPSFRVPSPRGNQTTDRSDFSSVAAKLVASSTQPLTVPSGARFSIEQQSKNSEELNDSKSTDSSKDKEWTSKSAPSDHHLCKLPITKTAPGPIARSKSMQTKEDGHKRAGSDSGAIHKNNGDKSPVGEAKSVRTKRSGSNSSSTSSISRSSLAESPAAATSGVSPPNENLVEGATETLATSDSDLDADNEIPTLEEVLQWDIVKLLKPKEKKRQEVINELFHTEKTHVRNLKILRKLFYEPLLSTQSKEFVKLLFSNLDEVLGLHVKVNCAMKAVTKRNKLVGDIGDLMLSFFDGDAGADFRKVAATFCHNQQYALEALKVRRKKDQKLAQFLQEAESCAICRKLQLKDMLPMEMQRLTKYPLLLETVAKYTPEPSEELDKLKRCIESSKDILSEVNTAKRNSENSRRLQDLQKRLDTKEFDRLAHTIGKEFKNLDLRRYTLIHDGHLIWKLGKNKVVEVHVVLLEEIILLFTRTSDGQRLSLKFHNINMSTGKEDVKSAHCPLLKLGSLIAKNVATDNKAFFIVSTSAHGPQIYEFVAPSTSDKKKWFKFINDQIEICKQKDAPPPTTEPTNVLQTKTEDVVDTPAAVTAPSTDPKILKLKYDMKNLFENTIHSTANVLLLFARIAVDEQTIATGMLEPTDAEDEHTIIERAAVVNQPKLINPCEVLISQPTVLEHAEPVLTPLEMLKRKDELIFRCLLEKHKILTSMFSLPSEDLEGAVDMSTEIKGNKEARELALAAIVQTNRILEAINEGMKTTHGHDSGVSQTNNTLVAVEQPAVSCTALTRIAAPLMKHLTALLHSLQMMEDDLRRLQTELRRYKSLATSVKDLDEERQTHKSKALHNQIAESCTIATMLTTNIDDYLRPDVAGQGSKLSVSSDDTLTDSKGPTPTAKSPASPLTTNSVDKTMSSPSGKPPTTLTTLNSNTKPIAVLSPRSSCSSSSCKVSSGFSSSVTTTSPEVINENDKSDKGSEQSSRPPSRVTGVNDDKVRPKVQITEVESRTISTSSFVEPSNVAPVRK